jgi:hypothetical protein
MDGETMTESGVERMGRREVTCYWWRRLTRGIIIFHNGTRIDEFESIRGKMSVLRKSLSESGEFGIKWWKGNLEPRCVQIRRQRDGSGKENGEVRRRMKRSTVRARHVRGREGNIRTVRVPT